MYIQYMVIAITREAATLELLAVLSGRDTMVGTYTVGHALL